MPNESNNVVSPLRKPAGASLDIVSVKHHVTRDIVCEGWVLKKRRRKMQGFARRYFTLNQQGTLSYSFEPGQPLRDQVSLHHAAITTAPGRKDIHVDSSTATFHMKCLNTDDFNMWMVAFRKFISLGTEARKSASVRLLSRQGNPSVSLAKSEMVAEELGLAIRTLEDAIQALVHDLPVQSKKHNSVGKKSDKDRNKDSGKDHKFGLFRRSGAHSFTNELGANNVPDATLNAFPPLQRVSSALEHLKAQHTSLVISLQALSDLSHSTQGSSLPTTVEEEERASPGASPRLTTPISRRSKRASIATTVSETVQEWFDALDGAEEFVIDADTAPEGLPSQVLTNESHSSLGQRETLSTDTEIDESYNEARYALPSDEAIKQAPQATRRSELPSRSAGDEGSLFAILKKNVGKDLSAITFPVTFNEPLTLLQRAAEEIEYYSILDDAAGADNPIDRICYVAAFAVSSYAHTRHRSGRKGFNPMLGETFEDTRMKFVAEKVRHNPLEMAYHAEGEHWSLNATSAGKTKFWGKSLEIIPLGSSHLRIGQDHYVWKKPSSFMRNLMVGTKYLEHCGNMIIESMQDHMRCVLEFKQAGYWGPSNIVSGTVQSSSGEIFMRLEGKWDDHMAQSIDSSYFRVLWRVAPLPKNSHDYYGFTSFGIALNELTSDIVEKLPPTDSRFRPDVRALENGDIDAAEGQKLRVEELQRERRKQGKEKPPRWFHKVGEDWMYSGGYWEARARSWKGEQIQPLW